MLCVAAGARATTGTMAGTDQFTPSGEVSMLIDPEGSLSKNSPAQLKAQDWEWGTFGDNE